MTESMSLALARNWWALALRGVAGVFFGAIALFQPAAAMLTLAWIFAAYLLVDGVFAIVAGIRAAERHERWVWLLAEGVFDLVMSAVVLAFPAGAILAFVLVTAGWALVTGILMLIASVRLHGSHGRIWLGLGGVISLVFGLMLAGSPLIGAVVLTWWLGAYAIAFGLAMLVLAFRLRGRRLEPTRAV